MNPYFKLGIYFEEFFYSPSYGTKIECQILNLHIYESFFNNKSADNTTEFITTNKKKQNTHTKLLLNYRNTHFIQI